ncbi:MAG TPA: ABC transporter permease [Thermoanaerobaculia bacterium]|jgi:ABC-2 type transport system permease protein|nr:ABC transporter permease [Thermoanaerobaculia bacterium]
MNPRKVWSVAWKELLQSSRDPLSLGMLLGVPCMMLLLYGYAVNFDVRHVALAVEDDDKSAASRELVASFVNSTYFDQVADLAAGADLRRLTERRRARAVLVIPEGAGRDLAAGRTVSLQLILDGVDANTATTALGYASALVAAANVQTLAAAGGRVQLATIAPIDYEPRVWYNPELKSTRFLVPGLIGFILMLTAVLSTAISVVREKERGTMEQLRVTSLKPGELILGKTLPYLGISLIATVLILIAARFLFGIAVAGPYLHLFAATLVYLIGALGLGLLVSSISDTQAVAFQAGALVSMLPAIFLSGFIFPIRSMPRALQIVTYAVPARYFNVVLRGVILKGAGLGSYPRDMAFLVLYALAVMGLAYVRLARKEV